MSSSGSVKSLRTPLGAARGLGAAGHGFQHWWGQRLTSIALVPLSLWFAFSVASLHGGYPALKAWLSGPCSAALALLTLAACETGPVYKPRGPNDTVGYTDQQLTANRFRVTFSGSSSVGRGELPGASEGLGWALPGGSDGRRATPPPVGSKGTQP